MFSLGDISVWSRRAQNQKLHASLEIVLTTSHAIKDFSFVLDRCEFTSFLAPADI